MGERDDTSAAQLRQIAELNKFALVVVVRLDIFTTSNYQLTINT
jgi:hypothetical protein